MRAKLFLSALLLAATSTTFAQSAAPTSAEVKPTAAQQAQLNQKIVSAAVQVTQLVDAGKMGEVWDGASAIAKQATTRDAFIQLISTDRKTLGPLTSRTVQGVGYSKSDGKKLPAGIYANVTFASKFASAKAPVRELVSFHLENDKTWRVTG
ncbi:MAG TPA: DUF4019 domain-containing protein, partial [Rhodanobacter sp.]|nr:DUF4019 domain-containing protein [Rhodanobacter sp.]